MFLCKSGLFLEKLNEKMGGDGVGSKERFGPEDFQVRRVREERVWSPPDQHCGITTGATPTATPLVAI